MTEPAAPAPASGKVTGTAKYPSDINRRGLLQGRVLRCPFAHAKITALDISAAQSLPGVRAVRVLQGVGAEIQWALDAVALVAAVSGDIAEDALRAVAVAYEVLPHFVNEEKPEQAPGSQPGEEQAAGDPDAALAAASARAKGTYGLPATARNRLEPHGQIYDGTETKDLLPTPLDAEAAELARMAGAPVKLVLDRAAELAVAGDRPAVYAEITAGAADDGAFTAWISKSWGAGDPSLPSVFQIPARRHRHTVVLSNTAGSQAPYPPKGFYPTMSALDDLAAKLGLDPYDVLLKNLPLTRLPEVYKQEMEIAAQLMSWRARWHPRGYAGPGPVLRGLGLSLHLWDGVHAGSGEPAAGAGVQMAQVAVDVETGVVKVERMIAVQDCGQVADLKAMESWVQGALILGISSTLAEEKVFDPLTGRMLNVDFESYKMAGIGDVGELSVHLMAGPGYDERGVLDLGEPPLGSSAAAVANAVANAIGIRVPVLPLTPERVLNALTAKGTA
jgi:CO/xanthine dehydrogenase Mo-binding subunit